MHQLAVRQFARRQYVQSRFAFIKPQLGFARVGVRTVTGETMRRKNRPHLAVKVRRILGHTPDCQKQQGAHPDEWPHPIISFITSPPTSVRRKSRPLWR